MSDYGMMTNESVPLSAPYYGATFGVAFKRFWQKYATFSGRASRSEFWWWELVGVVVWAVLSVILVPSIVLGFAGGSDFSMNGGIIFVIVFSGLWGVATIVPSLALAWRRLHDANFSGLFFLLSLIPGVGGLMFLGFALLPSDPRGARFDA